MKKIAFALQVFSLMTLLPLCVVMEMNHEREPSSENGTITEVGRNADLSPEKHPATAAYHKLKT